MNSVKYLYRVGYVRGNTWVSVATGTTLDIAKKYLEKLVHKKALLSTVEYFRVNKDLISIDAVADAYKSFYDSEHNFKYVEDSFEEQLPGQWEHFRRLELKDSI